MIQLWHISIKPRRQTDASPWGLSAILSQKTPGRDDRKIVAYASRSLSDVESRYSQTEKEALAIVWAIERLHLYLYGAPFTLYTDCKPVQLIFDNAKSKPPARIERWNLRLHSLLYTQKVFLTPLTSSPVTPVLVIVTSLMHLRKTMLTLLSVMQCRKLCPCQKFNKLLKMTTRYSV